MSTQIGDLIFESGKTLFEILDALDVPQVAIQLDAVNIRLDEVNDQLRQLGSIVDSNQASTTASFIAVNTQLDSLNSEVTALNLAVAPLSLQVSNLEQEVATLSAAVLPIEVLVSDLESQVNSLTTQVDNLTTLVNSYNSRINLLETNVSALTNRVLTLELTAARNQQLRLGNEYIFTYRTGGVPGITYYYRINYSGSTSTAINAAIGYPANVLSSQDGTSTQRTVYLAAPFDLFSVNGRYNYPMIQGPCRLSFSVNNTNPVEGYITTL